MLLQSYYSQTDIKRTGCKFTCEARLFYVRTAKQELHLHRVISHEVTVEHVLSTCGITRWSVEF